MNAVKLDREASDLWDKQADLRWGRYISKIEVDAINRGVQLVDPNCTQPAALDIGCEAGRWTELLIDNDFDVTATEICPDKVAACQLRNPKAKCVCVSTEDAFLPIEDNSVDIVICIEVEVAETDWFVPEVKRVLRDSGVVVFTLNNRQSYRGRLSLFKSWIKGDEYFYHTSFSEVRDMLTKHNFEISWAHGFCWLPFGRLSDSPLIPPLTFLESLFQFRRVTKFSPWVAVVASLNKE